MVRRICEKTVTLYFIFGLGSVAMKMFHSTFFVRMCWTASNSSTCQCGSRKKQIETPFKTDNVKALIKT